MTARPTVTIKEIASAAEVGEKTVHRRLRDWGIDEFVSTASKRPLKFFRGPTSQRLLMIRVIERPL